MINFKLIKETLLKRKAKAQIVKPAEAQEEKKLKIAYTVYPDEKLSYNELWEHVYREAKKI